jgi:hypothetical protein
VYWWARFLFREATGGVGITLGPAALVEFTPFREWYECMNGMACTAVIVVVYDVVVNDEEEVNSKDL